MWPKFSLTLTVKTENAMVDLIVMLTPLAAVGVKSAVQCSSFMK